MLNKELRIVALVVFAITLAFAFTSCVDNLNTSPIDDSIVTSVDVYDTPDDFRQVLAKLYAGFSATGQQGPAGMPDIQGIDEGFSSYIRQLWVHQTLPTDEAVVAWNDPGLPQFNFQDWGPSNDFVMGMYSRIYYEITLTNEFIREAQQRNEDAIRGYEAEARFLRALSYWHALDMFGGNVPFVTENDPIGAFMPEPASNNELFEYIENELLDILEDLQSPGQNDYGRADLGSAWALLTKLYLNAEVYTGQERYSDALEYAELLINNGAYDLADNYQHLFMADNDQPAVNREIIFPVRFDGNNLQTFGGTNFIIHAAIGGDMSPGQFGMDGGWGGHRVTPQFVEIFDVSDQYTGITTENTGGYPEIYVPGGYQSFSGYSNDWEPADAPPLISENNDDVYTGLVYFANAGAEFKFTAERNWNTDWGGTDGVLELGGANIQIDAAGLYSITVDLNNLTYEISEADTPTDSREMFFTEGQTLEIESYQDFQQGYAVTKWSNMRSTGEPGSNLEYADTDFPLFRLADVYLMYAEAVLRGGGGSTSTAVQLVNELRERAYGDASGNITEDDLTLDFILDERAKELYWEGHRRTDLRRYELYTGGDYVWSWKGGSQEGSATNERYEVFPIPTSDINSNINLTQNPGY